MWIFSELGFYSINVTPDGRWLQFRARKRGDLENLKRDFPRHFPGEIMTLERADYRYRLETPPAKAALVMAELTRAIEYRNFKSHLAGTDQADKLHMLHQLWNELYDYQTAQEFPGRKPGHTSGQTTFFTLDESGWDDEADDSDGSGAQ